MESRLYTTPEASRTTGIPEGTIRSWLSRHAGVFQEGTHIIIEESGRKLWTEEGIQLLQSRAEVSNASESASPDTAQSDAFISPGDFLEMILDQGSEELATRYFVELPVRTLERIKRMLAAPTDLERNIVKSSVQEAINLGRVTLLAPRNTLNLRSLPYAENQGE